MPSSWGQRQAVTVRWIQAQGHQLRRAAEESLHRPARSVARTSRPGDVEELQRRLIETQHGQLKAERAAHQATEL